MPKLAGHPADSAVNKDTEGILCFQSTDKTTFPLQDTRIQLFLISIS